MRQTDRVSTAAPSTRPDPASETDRPPRRRAVRIAGWVLAAVAAVLMMGLVDLGTLVGLSNPRYVWPVPLDVSWGTLFTFQLAGAYVWLAVRPGQPLPALVQLAVSAAALAISAVGGLDIRPLWVALGVGITAVLFGLVLLPSAPIPAPTWRRPGRRYALLAVGGLVVWTPYVVAAFDVSRSVHEEYITNGMDHWPVQGATGLALAGSAIVLAVWPAARPLIRGCVSISAALIGVAQLGYPGRDGALMTTLWGVGVVVWAVLVALVPPQKAPRSPA